MGQEPQGCAGACLADFTSTLLLCGQSTTVLDSWGHLSFWHTMSFHKSTYLPLNTSYLAVLVHRWPGKPPGTTPAQHRGSDSLPQGGAVVAACSRRY